MLNKKLECAEIKKLCRQCAKAKEERGKPCYWVTQENYFCKNCIIADNSLAWFKKNVVDENTRRMHEEVKKQFADRTENEVEWLKTHGFEKELKNA